MMYFPDPVHTSPGQAGLSEAQEVELKAADGEYSLAWHVAPREGRPVTCIFTAMAVRFAIASSASTACPRRHRPGRARYRGYGGDTGTPTEAGLTADAEAAYAFAAARYPAKQIVLWGELLGTGVAVALAAHKPVGRVILEAPFTSAAAVAGGRYWLMPVRLLMKDQYRSDELIGRVKLRF